MRYCVRKHRAPKSALRLGVHLSECLQVNPVRKHRAPNGALRPERRVVLIDPTECQKAPSAKRYIKTGVGSGSVSLRCDGQKAPSAKRCIKTEASARTMCYRRQVRKHRAPKGALRPLVMGVTVEVDVVRSESTERQKVH